MVLVGLLFYIASLVFGFTAVNFFFEDAIKEILPKYGFGVPVGYAIATYLVLAQEIIVRQFSDMEMILASVILLALSALLYVRAKNRDMFSWKKFVREVNSDRPFHIVLFIVIAFFLVMQMAGVHNASTGVVAGDNYGPDVLSQIGKGTSLIYSGWPPTLLYTYNATNVEPFINNFYTAMLMYNGFGLVNAWWAMTLPLWFSLAVCTIYFMSLLLKRRLLAVAGLFLMLFCSLGLNMIIAYIFNIQLFTFPPGLFQQFNGNWLNIVTYPFFNFSDPMVSNFVIQPTFLMGFPYALLFLTLLYVTFFDRPKKVEPRHERTQRNYLIAAGLLVGLMPLIHPFSLVFVFFFALVAFLYSLAVSKNRKSLFFGTWLPFGIAACIFAIPEYLFMNSQQKAAGFMASVLTQPFWYQTGANILYLFWLHVAFWIESIGLTFILGLAGLYLFRKRIYVFIPAIMVLALVNIVRLSPSFGDGNKFTVYFLLFMSISAMALLYTLWRRGAVFKALAIALYLLMTFSGLVSEQGVFGYYPIADTAVIAASNWAAHNTSINNVFLTNCADNTFGFFSTLGGRKTVLEYYYYIFDDGIFNYNPDAVYAQENAYFQYPTCNMIHQFNVSYVAIESIRYFAPNWCAPTNYSYFTDPANFTLVKSFSGNGDNIEILKPLCGTGTANAVSPYREAPGSCRVVRPGGAYTANGISLNGTCSSGELPQFVANFTGSTDVAVPDSPALDPTNAISVSLWVKTQNVTQLAGMLEKRNSGAFDGYAMLIWGVSPFFELSSMGFDVSGYPMSAGQWYNLIGAWNESTGIATYYMDGSLVNTVSGKSSPDAASNSLLYIGSRQQGTSAFVGEMADVQVYNTSLTPHDAAVIYGRGLGGAPVDLQNLVGWWPLNGNANDYSGNGDNGNVSIGMQYAMS